MKYLYALLAIVAVYCSLPVAAYAQAHVSTAQVNLAWTAPTNSSGLPVCTPQLIAAKTACWDPFVGYNAYRALSGTSPFTQLNTATITTTSYTDLAIQSSQTYNYIVESVDASGTTSTPSNTAVVTTPGTPGKPTVIVNP